MLLCFSLPGNRIVIIHLALTANDDSKTKTSVCIYKLTLVTIVFLMFSASDVELLSLVNGFNRTVKLAWKARLLCNANNILSKRALSLKVIDNVNSSHCFP